MIFEFFKHLFGQFWLWMINVIIILDVQMVSIEISPNLTKNRNLPKISRLVSQSLDRPIKSHIVQNIYHMLVFTRPKGLSIGWPNKKSEPNCRPFPQSAKVAVLPYISSDLGQDLLYSNEMHGVMLWILMICLFRVWRMFLFIF